MMVARQMTTFWWCLLSLVLLLFASSWSGVHGYASNPELSRGDMAGLWRLTGAKSALPVLETTSASHPYPMKEFTVYPKKKPKKKKQLPSETTREVLLMLLEDGSFQQYGQPQPQQANDQKDKKDQGEPSRRNKRISSSKQQPQEKSTATPDSSSAFMGLGILKKGTWDYLDGKLILAADRPPNAHLQQVHDTMLVGKVVSTTKLSMVEQPITLEEEEDETTTSSQEPQQQQNDHQDAAVDTHLSVPKGSVEVGKFMYPKTHPSFFEQTMFQPTPTGSFQLSQVLGSLNTKSSSEKQQEFVEKFTKADFVDKHFLLTSHPIPPHKPKGNIRWSIKYNKFVEDPPRKQQQEQEQQPIPIRVLELLFFQNNTFSTVAGLGSSVVLRGKWDIRGDERDQLWMQVWRFGFGRSVSGSTYSEGMGLNKDDEKAYWGIISHFVVEQQQQEDSSSSSDDPAKANAEEDVASSGSLKNPNQEEEKKRIEVKGSVLIGWGLEPEPVARFIMREVIKEEVLYDEEEDEDDDDEQDNHVAMLEDLMGEDDEEEPGDWSNAFQ